MVDAERMGRIRTLAVVALGLISFASASSAQQGSRGRAEDREQRPTVLRVVLPNGRPAAGALVQAVGTPEPEHAASRPFRLVRAEANARGVVKLPLEDGVLWGLWAVLDQGKLRFASEVADDIEPGRGGVLRLEEFPVPFVRLVGVDAWRAALKEEPRLQFTPEGAYGVPFAVPLPKGDEPIVRLPALPLGNYFPTLLDASGRRIDFTYFSPAFHESEPEVEPLYERDHPLKRAVLGKPVVHEYRIRGPEGDALSGARMDLSPSLPIEGSVRYRADEDGRVRVVLPWRPQNVRASYSVTALVWAPGHWPVQKTLEIQEEARPGPEPLKLTEAGRILQLDARPLRARWGPDARFYVSSLWAAGRLTLGPTERIELPIAESGFFELPSMPSADVGFDLWVAADGVLTPIFNGTPEALLQSSAEELAKPVELTLRVARPGGGKPLGARLWAAREGPEGRSYRSRVFERYVPRSGLLSLELPPGRWVFYLRSVRDGDVLVQHEVRRDDRRLRPMTVELAPFRVLEGRVVDAANEGVANLDVTVQLQAFVQGHPRLTQLLQRVDHSAETDASGHFRVLVSSLATRLMVWCSRQVDGQWSHATQNIDWTKAEQKDVLLRLGS